MKPHAETLRVYAKRLLVGLRVCFAFGILVGIPGLASRNDQPSAKSPQLTKVFAESSVLAKESVVTETEPVRLDDWPDLFDESGKAETIQPTHSPDSSVTKKKVAGPVFAAESKKKSSPSFVIHPRPKKEDPIPSLHNSLVKVNEKPQGSIPSSIHSDEGTPKIPDPLKPVETSKKKISTGKTAVAKASTDASKGPSKAVTKPKKGFIIRVEGEGKDLVVYNAEGKEVLRKSRKAKVGGTTISGGGRTLTNRNGTPEFSKPKDRVADSKTDSKKQSSSKEKGSHLLFDEVKKGENLSLIASRYPGVTAEDLMRVNQIDDPHSIAAGTRIWIPTNGLHGLCHRVRKNETLSSLLKKYEIKDMFKVCDINGLDFYSTNKLKEGQLLVIPDAHPKHFHPKTRTARAIRSDLSKLKGNVRWKWPVDRDFKVSSGWGRRIDPFSKRSRKGAGGPKPRFSMHHGIDLAIPVGTPVHAARDGEVIEVSHSRYGHGNMIKIRHEDGWCTVYSHNSKLLKKKGDRVKQGEVIALSGNTGRSTGPHLHFEVRRPNQESVNPKSLLPSL